MENPRVVINGRFLCQNVSGVQRVAYELTRRLKKLDPSITVVCPANIQHKEWAEELQAETVKGFTLAQKGVLWEQLSLPFFLQWFHKPLLVGFGNTGPLFYKNQLVLLHDVAFLAYPQYFSFIFKTFYKFLWFFLSRRVRQIVTVSHFSKNEIEKYLPKTEGKIEVIYNGFNTLRRKPASSATSHYFLMVGSWDGRKNITRAIEAFMMANIQGVSLKIVGAKSKVFKNKEITYPANIEFLGQQDDEQLAALYHGAIGLLYPSLYEGFGLPPLEAMACGCPVIASDIPVLHEVAGEGALFVSPHNTEAIAQALLNLYQSQDLREELKHKGRLQIDNFNWEMAASRYLEFILKNT